MYALLSELLFLKEQEQASGAEKEDIKIPAPPGEAVSLSGTPFAKGNVEPIVRRNEYQGALN